MQGKPGKWLRFAVLFHYDWPDNPDHYDLVLEKELGEDSEEEKLMKFKSEKMPKGKEFFASFERMIRRRYLTYEGPMSGNRGKVRHLDDGLYRQIDYETVEFNGKKLKGVYLLDCICPTYRKIEDAHLWMKAEKSAVA